VLFAAGEKGFNLLPGTSFNSFFQERTGAAATTPAGNGDPVGTVLDNITGLYATAPSDAARPILAISGGLAYLTFNGATSALNTGNINFSDNDELSVWAAVLKNSDAAAGVVYEVSTNSATSGASGLFAPSSAVANYGFRSSGSAASLATATTYTAPITNVVSGQGDISSDTCLLRVNGVQVATSATDQGTGNRANQPLYIGARAGGTLPFNGRIYGFIIRGKATADMLPTERYLAGRAGVTF
jgi:hypothetical protein